MNYPDKLIRRSDSIIFDRNKDNTYTMRGQSEHMPRPYKYSYERLMDTGSFIDPLKDPKDELILKILHVIETTERELEELSWTFNDSIISDVGERLVKKVKKLLGK